MILRAIILLPVWLLTLCIKPMLPRTHPWKRQRLTLKWCVDGASADTILFGCVIWAHSLIWIYVAYLWLLFRQ